MKEENLEKLQKQIDEAQERLHARRQKFMLEKNRMMKKIRALKIKLQQDVSKYDEAMSTKQSQVESIKQGINDITSEKAKLNLSFRKHEYKSKRLDSLNKTLAQERFAEEQVWNKKNEGSLKFQKAYRSYKRRSADIERENASNKKK